MKKDVCWEWRIDVASRVEEIIQETPKKPSDVQLTT